MQITTHTSARANRARTMTQALALTLALGTSSAGVFAAETASSNPADSKWRVRARVIGIIPDDSSGNINLEAGGTRTPLSAGVKVDNAVVPELDLTYMVTPNFGIEVIAGMANHDVRVDGNDPVLGGALGVGDDFKIFDAWVLPPTVTFQYHFMPSAKFRPYVGVGVNYTAFLWNDATDRLESTLGSSVDVDTSSSWGWAAQFGFDYDISGNWFANFDVKYIDIDTTASLLVKNLGAGLRVRTAIDPWVIGAGIGYRF